MIISSGDKASQTYYQMADIGSRHSSPPSTCSAQGRKPGTLDPCYRKKLEEDSGALLGRTPQADLNSRSHFEYQPQRSSRLSEKVYIPVKEFPQVSLLSCILSRFI
jgi:splicing factor 1